MGALAVADSDPNVIYAGMGEACVRGNASNGDGVYKSVDAGKTWRNVGLQDSYHIGAVKVHPKNPDIVYVAALGHLWGPNAMRGVYRSTDGGATWKQVLTRGAGCGRGGSGARSLQSACHLRRHSGRCGVSRGTSTAAGRAAGSGRSTDGGDTWSDISRSPGLPKGVLGRIGITVSPVNPERVWAIVEAADGGVFRSDNGGRNWTKVNEQSILRQRAWYYSHIFADPQAVGHGIRAQRGHVPVDRRRAHLDADVSAARRQSRRSGSRRTIRFAWSQGNDGGATITNDGGHTWSTVMNQPTAQFYRVALDNDFPYNIYGAQQDNSTVRIASRTAGGRNHRARLV